MSVVGFALKLDGDVSSFTLSVQAQMQSAFAARAGVDPSAVELAITPGSVIVDVSIQTYAATATLVQSAMVSATSSTSSATAMLANVTGVPIAVLAVVTPPTIADVRPPPPPSPSPLPPMSPMSTGASAVETRSSMGITIGVIVGVSIAFVFALVFLCRRCCYKQSPNLPQETKEVELVSSDHALVQQMKQPDYWDKEKAKSAPDGFAAIALNKTDPTFTALGRFLETDKAKLLKSGADRSGTSHDTLKLACAWRLENPVLWHKYIIGVQSVGRDMERIRLKGIKPAGGAPVMTGSVASSLPGQLRANVNEAFLMHGTGVDVVLEIISKGFNERFAGSAAGAVFGQGTYLAEDAGKCDQYTKMDIHELNAGKASDLHKFLYSPSVPHPGKVFYILVCRVARGYHVRTEKVYRQDQSAEYKSADTGQPVFPVNDRELSPVLNISSPNILHHSLLADVLKIWRYREFIVFHSDLIYPEHLLAYQRFQSAGSSLKGPYDGISHTAHIV
jgi:hypothetical protein